MVKTSEMSMELKQELAFTKEELAELEAAKKMPITFDADCPETTPERAVKFRRVNPPRNRMDAHFLWEYCRSSIQIARKLNMSSVVHW